jgi:hypothetical protein
MPTERDVYGAAMSLGRAENRQRGLQGKGDGAAYRAAMEETEYARRELTAIARGAGMKDCETWVVGEGAELVIVSMRGISGAGATIPDRAVVWGR